MLPEPLAIPRRVAHQWRRRGKGPFKMRNLKGPGDDPLVEGATAAAQTTRARDVAETAAADMRQLTAELGDQPTDPPSTRYETEAQAVKGCATPPEGGRLLYGVVRATRPRSVVEIGTAHGYGAYYIASALDDNGGGHLHTLEGRRACIRLARETVGRLGVADRVTIVEGDFRDTVPRAMDRPDLDLVFSDGDKSVELTRSQFEEALGSIPHAGFMLFDDINFNREIRSLFSDFVAHPRVDRAASFHGRWALLQLAPSS